MGYLLSGVEDMQSGDMVQGKFQIHTVFPNLEVLREVLIKSGDLEVLLQLQVPSQSESGDGLPSVHVSSTRDMVQRFLDLSSSTSCQISSSTERLVISFSASLAMEEKEIAHSFAVLKDPAKYQ